MHISPVHMHRQHLNCYLWFFFLKLSTDSLSDQGSKYFDLFFWVRIGHQIVPKSGFNYNLSNFVQ